MLTETDPEAEAPHACRTCGASIAARFTFTTCNRCALDALTTALTATGYYEARKRAAYERLTVAGLLPAKERSP